MAILNNKIPFLFEQRIEMYLSASETVYEALADRTRYGPDALLVTQEANMTAANELPSKQLSS